MKKYLILFILLSCTQVLAFNRFTGKEKPVASSSGISAAAAGGIAGDTATVLRAIIADAAMDSANRAVATARGAIKDSLNADTLRYYWLRVLPADSSASGISEPGIAGETVTFGQSVYFKSDGKWWLTDADTVITMPSMGVVVTKGSTAANGAVTILKSGFVRCDAWNWIVGNGAGMIYPSTTPGVWTQTAVSGTSDNLQFAGYARTADVIYYWPCYLMVQIN